MLAVVFFHMFATEKRYGGAQTILPDFLQFGMIGVDLFFVISGFVIATITHGKFRIPKEALKFIYHRITRIYPLYWVYSLLVLIVFIVHPAWVNSSQGNKVDILASFLLIPSENLPLVLVGWTLIYEMYFYLIFSLILLMFTEKMLPFVLICWSVVIILLYGLLETKSPVMNIISSPLTIEFIGGAILAILLHGKTLNVTNKILLIIVAVSIATSFYGYTLHYSMTGFIEPTGWFRFTIFGIPSILIVYALVQAEKNGYAINSSLIKVGNASYSIYLSHVLTLNVLGRFWSLFSNDGILDNIIMVPVVLAMVIIVGIISYKVIEKPLIKLSRRIV